MLPVRVELPAPFQHAIANGFHLQHILPTGDLHVIVGLRVGLKEGETVMPLDVLDRPAHCSRGNTEVDLD